MLGDGCLLGEDCKHNQLGVMKERLLTAGDSECLERGKSFVYFPDLNPTISDFCHKG